MVSWRTHPIRGAQKLRERLVCRNHCNVPTTHGRGIGVFRDWHVLCSQRTQRLMNLMSTVLTVTDLSSESYRLVGFAASIAGLHDGEVILVSTYGGGSGRRSEPPISPRTNLDRWKERMETRLRQEGQLLERQRQWCADQGVRCRAELYEDGTWPELVLQSAERSDVDLILVGLQTFDSSSLGSAEAVERLIEAAPCPVSVVRLPALTAA